MSAIYIGAALDLRILKSNNFDFINKFYYIDKNNDEIFIKNINKAMQFHNMKLINIDNNVRTYYNKKNNKKIIYYLNTELPKNYENIKNINFDILIFAGYNPDSCILKNKKNIKFIGLNDTFFKNDFNNNKSSILYKIHNEKLFKNIFCNYICIFKLT